jgi:hypothetical protein
LNWAAAFLVSSTSTLIPIADMAFLVAGLNGVMLLPVPMIRRSEVQC